MRETSWGPHISITKWINDVLITCFVYADLVAGISVLLNLRSIEEYA